jgi:hypothetical protein
MLLNVVEGDWPYPPESKQLPDLDDPDFVIPTDDENIKTCEDEMFAIADSAYHSQPINLIRA